MAIRQYIGARYVPKYMGHFDSTIAYEPLSIVDDANGNSYTSKIPVPAGSSLDDTRYWAQTGNFSGAVLQLQNRMTTAEGDIDDLQTRMNDAEGDIDDLQTRMGEAETKINTISNKKILIVADSYGAYKDTQDRTIGQLMQIYTGINTEMIYQGSIGFQTSPANFKTLLETYTGNKNEITDIIVVGGANDIVSRPVTIGEGVSAFSQYAKANFPNAKLHCFACGVVFGGIYDVTNEIRFQHKIEYNDTLPKYGIELYTNSFYVLCDTRLLNSDRVHPNPEGIIKLCTALSESYLGSVCDIDTFLNPVITYGSNIRGEQYFTMFRQNGKVSISRRPEQNVETQAILALQFTTPIPVVTGGGRTDGFTIGTVSGTLAIFNTVFLPCYIIDSNGKYTMANLMLSLSENNLTLSAYVVSIPDATIANVKSVYVWNATELTHIF